MEGCFSWAGTLYHYLSWLDALMALGVDNLFPENQRIDKSKQTKPVQASKHKPGQHVQELTHLSLCQDTALDRWFFLLSGFYLVGN